jgi:chromosome segregation ATPase
MNTDVTNEKQLIADIDHLREQFPQTQDLYREVCILLFFRYGMTPTANKLYQLVHKGSMSAPAEALNKFWEDLREKSRVRIEHPDLPEALKIAAGELTAALWSNAQAQAHETLASYQSEAQAAVLEAKAALTVAETQRDTSIQVLKETERALTDARERIGTLDQQLAAAGATHAALESQLTHAKMENAAHQQRLEDARRDFSSELDKLREAAKLAEERLRAVETRALLEIDRERNSGAKLQKELDATRAASNQATERNRSALAATQEQLGDLRQRVGMLEGNLQAVTATRDLTIGELKTAQAQLADALGQTTYLRVEIENWHRKAEEFERIATDFQAVTKPARSSRKAKQD